ncbi:MAG: YdcH family protein [Rickettsiales bacterium]|nr:YdcH family protein [Rickettsiales bacterium]
MNASFNDNTVEFARHMDDEIKMEKELSELRDQHRDVDSKIDTLLDNPFQDQLRLMRLKREKLKLKDKIFALEEMMYPDIIA